MNAISTVLSKVKLHAPPTTLIVAILTWLFGRKVDGQVLQQIGAAVTLVLSGAYLPAAAGGVSSAASAVKAKVAPPAPTTGAKS